MSDPYEQRRDSDGRAYVDFAAINAETVARYDDHKRQVEAAMNATLESRPRVGGMAEFILPPDLLVLYRFEQILDATGVDVPDPD